MQNACLCRSHIVHHEEQGYVITEFLPPVSWAGQFNTIAGSAGHHIYEGRWLKNPKVLDDYSSFWFSPRANPRAYTAWLTNAIHARLECTTMSILETLLQCLATVQKDQ